MEIERKYNETTNCYDYRFDNGNISLLIRFGENLDLYFALRSSGVDVNKFNSFYITKENMIIYNLFEKLYIDIENINLFGKTEEDKLGYRLFDMANYNKLYNPDTNTITWCSDETAFEVANYLQIAKEEEKFKLDFFTKPDMGGYERDYHTKYSIPIRFRNSGSRYDPFNRCFMKFYHELQKYDPEYHQITIEEYKQNYEKKLKYTIRKNCQGEKETNNI